MQELQKASQTTVVSTAPQQTFVSDFVAALLNRPNQGISAIAPRPALASQIRYMAALWTVGAVLMTAATYGMVSLGIFDRPGTAVLIYLLIIILLSLLDSFVTSAVFSCVAVACLAYFFMVPLYSFKVSNVQDVVALVAFLITSFAITTLVRRARRFGEVQHEQANLLDLTPDAILALDANRVITYWNNGAERLFGWRRDEAIGKVAHLLLKTVYPVPVEEIVETSKRIGHWEGELVHTTRDGVTVFVAGKSILRRDTRGNPIGSLESNTDVTARRLAEAALQRSQAAYLSEAQRLSHTGSFGWNVTTGELTWSEETFRIFGYPAGSKPYLQMVLARVHPEDMPLVEGVLDRVATDRQPLDFEHRLKMQDGSTKTLHVVARRSVDEPGNLFMIGAVMDITARKAAQETLERLQIEFAHAARISTLGELTASIAHELNQPLGAVAVNCEASLRWLNRPEPALDEVHALTKRSLAEARRAADIIDRVRGMAARRTPERVPLSLHDVILEALQFLRHEVEWRGITVSHVFSSAPSNVLADRTLLHQLIVNLAVNAVQAMAQVDASERKITVRTTSSDETTLRCSVEDSGPGIAPDHLPQLFDSFFTTKQGGMGMGLSVCRSIIEAHGGRIEADNGSVHGGARFSFALPTAGRALHEDARS